MPTSTLPSDRPTFFIDRDLGRHAFPQGLRQAGLSVVTLAEHYGIPQDQDISDHEWMLEAAHHGWPVLGACDTPGPFVYRVHPHHIERLQLD